MELSHEPLKEGVARIALAGRLDSTSAEQIGARFADLVAMTAELIVVDLSQVSYLASMGMQMLLSNAKAVARRGGRMVLAGPLPPVAEVLKLAGIGSLIPLYADVVSACDGRTGLDSPVRVA